MIHDPWIVGEGLEEPGRWYVIHTGTPRFIAEICDDEETTILGGIVWSLPNGQNACNIEFYDEPPKGEALDQLIFRLSEILGTYDRQTEERTERDRRYLEED